MSPKKQYYENIAKTMIQNMEKRQMKGYYCETKEEALALVKELIPAGASVGWGGSVTLDETGIKAALIDGDYEVYNRDLAKTAEEQKKVYGQICGCDYYFMSTNAITLNGELVNIDGRGYRVAFLCFGPENVVVIAGMNKVVTDVEDGFKRVRNMAAPPNTVRLNRNTPCAKTGKCGDCLSSDCICSSMVITRRSQIPGRLNVILVGEELGY